MSALLDGVSAALASIGMEVDASGAAWVLAWTIGVAGLTAIGLSLRGKVNLKVWFGGLAVVAPTILFLALGFQNDPHSITSPLLGKPAPDFVLAPYDGGATLRLSDQRGTPAVVNFWATWCVPCKQEHRTLVAVAKRMAGQVNFFGVVYQDEPEKIGAWLASAGDAYPQLLDVGSKAAIAYGVYGVPETYIIDKNGVITWKFTGPVDAASLLEQIQPLVSR